MYVSMLLIVPTKSSKYVCEKKIKKLAHPKWCSVCIYLLGRFVHARARLYAHARHMWGSARCALIWSDHTRAQAWSVESWRTHDLKIMTRWDEFTRVQDTRRRRVSPFSKSVLLSVSTFILFVLRSVFNLLTLLPYVWLITPHALLRDSHKYLYMWR